MNSATKSLKSFAVLALLAASAGACTSGSDDANDAPDAGNANPGGGAGTGTSPSAENNDEPGDTPVDNPEPDDPGASPTASPNSPDEPEPSPDADDDEPGPGDTPNPEDPTPTPEPEPDATPGTDPETTPTPDLGDDTGPGTITPDTNPGGVDVNCEENDEPGVSPLMKLSTVQYRNTVRDLLVASGIEGAIPSVQNALAAVPDDSLGDLFRNLDARVSPEHVQGYLDVGVALGNAVSANPEMLEALVGNCALEERLSDGCAAEFLQRFLKLSYRRPVDDAEIDGYLDFNDGERTPAEAVSAMLVVALSSPRFVNHVEIDGAVSELNADVLQLTAYELASRLSYTFWHTMPDAELFAAADDGSLATESGFETQLNRVFQHERTRQTLWQFWNEWTKLEKFTGFETARPAFQTLAQGTGIGDGHDTYADMVQEIRDLTDLFTFDRNAPLADLLRTDLSVTRSPELAALYGVEPYSGSGDYPRIPAGTRAGMLQRGALLVSNLEQTNPFHRGALVRRAVLCDSLPQPDPNSLPPGSLDPPPLNVAQTTRERFQAKVEGNVLCEACHLGFSDIGYVLESFDSLGRHRTTEIVYDEQTGEALAELPINTSAVARIDFSDDTPVADAFDLNERIVESGKVEACLARNYFSYSARREIQANTRDACVVQDLTAVLRDPEQGLANAFRRIAQYETFFQRKVGPR